MNNVEIRANVKEIVKEIMKKGFVKEENSVVHMEAISCVLIRSFFEEFVNVAIADETGVDTYEFLYKTDFMQEVVNENYGMYGELSVKLSELDNLFLRTVQNYLMYHAMETALAALMHTESVNQDILFKKLQILTAEQYCLIGENLKLVSETSLGNIVEIYNKNVEEAMLKFPLNLKDLESETQGVTRIFNKEEIERDARFSFMDKYIMQKTPVLVYPMEDTFKDFSEFGKYESYTILNYNSMFYLADKYNLNILDLKNFIETSK